MQSRPNAFPAYHPGTKWRLREDIVRMRKRIHERTFGVAWAVRLPLCSCSWSMPHHSLKEKDASAGRAQAIMLGTELRLRPP